MNSKKSQARFEMLKLMSKKKSSELHEPTIGEKLKSKKLTKLPPKEEEEDEEKGLSKAQEILKKKLGSKLGLSVEEDGEEESEEKEEDEHDVDVCPIKDCALCNEATSAAEELDEEDEEADA